VGYFARLCRKWLYTLSVAFRRLYRATLARPKLTFFILIVTTTLFSSQLNRLKFYFSAEDMVGEGIDSADELSSIKDRYAEGTTSFLYLIPPAGTFSYSHDQLCDMRRWYSFLRMNHPEFKRTFSTFDVAWPVEEQAKAIRFQNVLPLDCYHGDSIKTLEQGKLDLDQTPWPSLHDINNRLSFVFSFTFKDAEDSKFGNFNPKILKSLRDSVEQKLLAIVPGSTVHWVGSADYQWYVLQGYRFSIIVNSAMLLALFLGLRFAYGTWTSGLIFCLTLILNGIWIYGSKAITNSPYDLLSSGLFTIIAVSALEDFAFISAEQMRGSSWRAAMRKMAIPSLFTSLTTVVGFLSLYVSDLAMIRRFGIWCAYGAFLEWILVFLFTPAFLSIFYKRANWVNLKRARAYDLSESLSRKKIPRFAARACLIVFPLAILFFGKLSANDTPSGVLPQTHPYNVGLSEIQKSKGWQSTVSLLMRDPVKYPEGLSKLEDIVDHFEKESPARNQVAAIETPLRVINWLHHDKSMSRDMITINFQYSDPFRKLIDENGVPRAILYLKENSVDSLQLLKKSIAELCPNGECHVGGDLIAYSDFSTQIPRTLINSMVLSLLMVGSIIAFLAVCFGQQRFLPQMLASSFWGPCAMLFIIALLQVPMNFMKCIFAGVLVGLTGDNVIQYLFASKRGDIREGIASRGSASLQTTVFMILTSLMYLFSYFTPPKQFGLIMASGLLIALVGDLWLLNGLLKFSAKKKPSSN
jgi:predicted RND superfamily exporter protein